MALDFNRVSTSPRGAATIPVGVPPPVTNGAAYQDEPPVSPRARDGVKIAALDPYIGEIACRLFGAPNAELSSRDQLRFGTNGSLAVEIGGEKAGSWFNHENGIGGGAWQLLTVAKRMLPGPARDWLRAELGIELEPLRVVRKSLAARIVATYDYTDECSELLFQVARLHDPKDFRQRRPDGRGRWEWKTKGVRQVPYRLPELIAGQTGGPVFIVEGEKDADALAGLGLVASCNPGGAGKWRPEFSRYFEGADVVVIPDNDEAGRDHARAIVQNLTPVAARVRKVDLPGLPEKGDVSDWLAAGGTREQLEAIVAEAVPVVPTPAERGAANFGRLVPREIGGEAPVAGSEDEYADAFSVRHADRFRYVAKWGRWLRWDGARWKFEETLAVFDEARIVAREFANIAREPGIAKAGVVAAIERLARADRRHAATVDIWDADPWLLNTPGSTVDLRTGATLPHDPARYITRITAVAPGGDCPLWQKFLGEVTNDDGELQSFLQRIAGYALTGSIEEHALFFFYGTGGNGKGVFLNAVSAILGDYAAVAPMEAFIATQGERHPTDLAGLRGARLVTAQETEEGRRWAESKIKALTGGDPISARFMRQDFFTYFPAFKLVIAGNHKPGLRGVDAAIRRRFNLVPFTMKVVDPDPKLPDKLRAEWPGILQWMLEGCLAWQRDGLKPPAVVTAATDAYLDDEDAIARWVEECCLTGAAYWCASADLWESWKVWAEASNERIGSRKMFAAALEGHEYTARKSREVRGYDGITLRDKPADPTELARPDKPPPEAIRAAVTRFDAKQGYGFASTMDGDVFLPRKAFDEAGVGIPDEGDVFIVTTKPPSKEGRKPAVVHVWET